MGIAFAYKPFLTFDKREFADLYIVRLAPAENFVDLEWLSIDDEFTIKIFKDGQEVKTVKVRQKRARIEGLEKNTEYSLIVESAKRKSLTRLFKTGDFRGTVINYLHPKDRQYEYHGSYLASPDIVRFKGNLYASMDIFKNRKKGEKGACNLTLLYHSKDDGQTWEYVADLLPAFWGSLFVAQNKLCLIASSAENGSLIISCSVDGEHWETPTELLRGLGDAELPGVHKAPGAVWIENDRVYVAVEFGSYGIKRLDNLLAVADLTKNIMDYEAWTFTAPAMVDFSWGGDQDIRFAIEGNTVGRNGEIFNILRYAYKKALMMKYNKDNPENPCEFYKVIEFPLGHCKFYIQQAEDGTYYAMGNPSCYPRNQLELYKSYDLEQWEKVRTLEDISNLDKDTNGYQYPSFILEGKKAYTVIRAALNGAASFHDSNAIVFRKFEIE